MILVRSLLMSAAALVLAAGMAQAQGTAPSGPGGNTGTGPVTGPGNTPGATPAKGGELDLPAFQDPEGAVFNGNNGNDPNEDENQTPIPEENDGDDPNDTPPPTLYGEEIDTGETDSIIYVLDISGSMGWDSQPYTKLDGSSGNGQRIDRAKAELGRSVMGLSDNFMFNIIAYDCGTRQWKSAKVEATQPNKQSAVQWTFALRPTGATGTGPATALGLGDKENLTVVLLTDGAPNCGASGMSGHRQMISSANSQGAKINVFGIAASGSYKSFCQAVASDSGGSYFDVP